MIVDCLYRLYPYGEILYGKYDTCTGLVEGLEHLGAFPMPEEWWAAGNYNLYGHTFNLTIIEYYMVCHEDCFLAVECSNLCLYACHMNCAVRMCYGDPEKTTQVYYFNEPGWGKDFKELGYVRTVSRQYGRFDKLRTFALHKPTGMINIAGGWFNPTWDISDCVGLSPSYDGYKDAMQRDADGVVYLQNKPFAIKRDLSSRSLVLI